MASYLFNLICTRNIFPGLGLSCHISELLVHMYFIMLWENRYNKSYVMICYEFFPRLYSLIFKQNFPRLLEAAKKVNSRIGHWYLEEKRNYLRIFRAIGAPHLFPYYVPDRMVLGEIYYQTIFQGFNASLVKDNKRAFIMYGFSVSYYFLKYFMQGKNVSSI
jgi:hypothetical protein